jgi:hypothetical protein
MSYSIPDASVTEAPSASETSAPGGSSIDAKQQEERNSRANGRAALIDVINTLPMSSVSSLKLFASMISVVTRKTGEVTQDTAVR